MHVSVWNSLFTDAIVYPSFWMVILSNAINVYTTFERNVASVKCWFSKSCPFPIIYNQRAFKQNVPLCLFLKNELTQFIYHKHNKPTMFVFASPSYVLWIKSICWNKILTVSLSLLATHLKCVLTALCLWLCGLGHGWLFCGFDETNRGFI